MAKKRLRHVAVVLMALTAAIAACSQVEKPSPTTGGTLKMKYGPFNVPDANSPGKSPFSAFAGFLGARIENGSIWNQPVTNVKKPCDNCWITGITAGLEYPDGRNANIDTGLWLHHMVLMNQGKDTVDATCASNPFSLPHFAVGGSGANTERFFASGNERTPVELGKWGNYGYKVNKDDKFHLLVDLMNMNTTAKDAFLTLEFEYEPISQPRQHAEPIWLDANQCGTSEVPAQTGAYTLTSTPYLSTVAGKIVGAGGHLHDGGTTLDHYRNGQQYCSTEALYGTKPEFIEPEGNGTGHTDGGEHDSHGGLKHISEHSVCTSGLPTIAKGDNLTLKANYDDAVHPQMLHGGQLHSVMGIGVIYVAQ